MHFPKSSEGFYCLQIARKVRQVAHEFHWREKEWQAKRGVGVTPNPAVPAQRLVSAHI